MTIRPAFFEDTPFSGRWGTLLIDLDGTLVSDNNTNFEPKVLKVLQRLKKQCTVYICTNSKNITRNTDVAVKLDVPVISDCSKPRKKVIITFPLVNPLCVVGDKILTDYLFAKRLGASFIYVRRKLNGKERWFIKVYNLVDNIVYQLFF
jgi:predicted HAD superfamily phosphohydrolase YqeG